MKILGNINSNYHEIKMALASLLVIAIIRTLGAGIISSLVFTLFVGFLLEFIHCYAPTHSKKLFGKVWIHYVDWDEFIGRIKRFELYPYYPFNFNNIYYCLAGIAGYIVISILLNIF